MKVKVKVKVKVRVKVRVKVKVKNNQLYATKHVGLHLQQLWLKEHEDSASGLLISTCKTGTLRRKRRRRRS